MSAEWFVQRMKELRLGPSALARTMIGMGDDRPMHTILRGIQRMRTGKHRISGEMRVLLNLIAHKQEYDARAVEDKVFIERTRREFGLPTEASSQ